MAEIGNLSVKIDLDYSTLSHKLKIVQNDFKAAAINLGDFGKTTEGMKLKSDTLTKQLEIQRQQVQALENSIARIVEVKGADTKATQLMEVKLSRVKAQMAGTEAELKKVTAELEKQTSRWGSISASLEKTGSKLSDVGGKITDFGNGLSKSVTAPILAAGGAVFMAADSIKGATDIIRQSTGAVGAEFDELSDSFKKVFANAPDSAETVANTLSKLKIATGQAGEALEDLTSLTLDYAKVNRTDAAESADVLGRMLNGLALDINEIPGYMDKMTKASQMSGIGVNQLAEYIIGAGPAFEELGYGVNRSIALFASFYKAGAQPQEVVSSLNKVMITLTKEGFTDAEAAFAELLRRVKDAPTLLEGVEIAAEAFGSKMGGNIADDIRAGRFEVEDWVEALKGAEGTIQKTADETGKFSEKLATLKNKATVALEPFGVSVVKVLEDFLNVITPTLTKIGELAEGFSDLDEGTRKAIITTLALVAAIGPVTVVSGKATQAVGNTLTAISKLGTSLIWMATNPIGQIILVLGVLVAAGVTVYKNWDKIRDFGLNAWGALKIGVLKAIDAIASAYEKLLGWIPTLGGEIRATHAKIRAMIEEEQGIISTRALTESASNWAGFRQLDEDSQKVTKSLEELKTTTAAIVPSLENVGKASKGAAKDTKAAWEIVADTLGTQMQLIKLQQENAALAAEKFGDETDTLAEKVGWLNEQLKLQAAIVEAVSTGYQKSIEQKGVQSDETLKLAVRLEQEKKAYAELEKQIRTTNQEMRSQARELESLGTSLQLLKAKQENAALAAEKFGGESEVLASKFVWLNRQLELQGRVVEIVNQSYQESVDLKSETAEETKKLALALEKEKKVYADIEKEIRNTNTALANHSKQLKDLADEVVTVEKSYRKNLADALKEYERKVKDVNQSIIDDEKRVQAEYESSLDARAKSLRDFVGLFDEVTKKDVSGEQLLENLRGQVEAFGDWQEGLIDLAAKGVDQGLIEELKQIGPKAGPEIAALNTLTQAQLTEYVALWKEKNTSAREEAVAQLQQQRREMQQKLQEIRATAATQLDAYRKEWEEKNAEIRENADKEMNRIQEKFESIAMSGTHYGIALMDNFIGGMESRFERLRTTIENVVGMVGGLGSASINDLTSRANVMNAQQPAVGGNQVVYNQGANTFNITVQDGEDLLRTLHKLGVSIP